MNKELLRAFKEIGIDYAIKDFSDNVMKNGNEKLLLAALLTYCSPREISFKGFAVTRGNLITLFSGDTGTGKTETIKKIVSWLNLGVLVSALESPNMLYCAAKKEGDWEFQPGYLISGNEVVFLDDAERSPLLQKSILSIRNRKVFVNPERYIPCNARFLAFSSSKEIDPLLFDLYILEEENKKGMPLKIEHLVTPELVRTVISWGNNLRCEDISFEKEAQEIISSLNELVTEKTARIAAAFAVLSVSATDEKFERLYIKKCHVEMALNLSR